MASPEDLLPETKVLAIASHVCIFPLLSRETGPTDELTGDFGICRKRSFTGKCHRCSPRRRVLGGATNCVLEFEERFDE